MSPDAEDAEDADVEVTSQASQDVPDNEPAFPTLVTPRSRTQRTQCKTGTPAEPKGGSTKSESDLLKMLTARAVETEVLKRKLDELVTSGDAVKQEKLNWGQWMASCVAQVADDKWVDFTRKSFDLIREFVPDLSLSDAPQVVRTVASTMSQPPTGGSDTRASYTAFTVPRTPIASTTSGACAFPPTTSYAPVSTHFQQMFPQDYGFGNYGQSYQPQHYGGSFQTPATGYQGTSRQSHHPQPVQPQPVQPQPVQPQPVQPQPVQPQPTYTELLAPDPTTIQTPQSSTVVTSKVCSTLSTPEPMTTPQQDTSLTLLSPTTLTEALRDTDN